MFRDAGARVVNVSIPSLKMAVPCYYILACAEASSNLARYDGIRYGFRESHMSMENLVPHASELHAMVSKSRGMCLGSEVIKRILTGSFVISKEAYDEYYGAADRIRTGLRRAIDLAFESQGIDFLMGPTTPVLPYELERPPSPASMLLNDFLTVPANLTGLPSISVPVAVSQSLGSLQPKPIGLQLIGRRHGESNLLKAAMAIELRAGFETSVPNWIR
jgi:aspartyl-tRNA(Asn)/glutamyl-tRNA(Gln) amidotransferase subunit A